MTGIDAHPRKRVRTPRWIHLFAGTALLCSGVGQRVDAGDRIAQGTEFQIPTATQIRASAPRKLTIVDLMTLRNIGEMSGTGLSVSPDGTHLAFEAHQANLENDTYRVAWFVGATANPGLAVNVGNGGDPTLFMNAQGAWSSKTPQWSADSQWIAYPRKEAGAVHIWRSYRDGTRSEQLTFNAADVQSVAWSKDGKRIYFSTDAPRAKIESAERQEAAHGYRVDDKDFNGFYRVQPLHPPYGLIGGRPTIWAYELDTRLEREGNPEERAEYEGLTSPTTLAGRPAARNVAVSGGGQNVAWLENRQPEVYRGFLAPLTVFASRTPDAGRVQACTAKECTGQMQGLWWNGNDEVVFNRVDAGLWSLYAWRPGSGKVWRVLATYDWISDCALAGGRAICFSEAPTQPRKIVAIDLKKGIVTTLLDPNLEWAEIQLGDVELLQWKNRSGRDSWGYLIKPLNYRVGKRYPLVIIQYDARMCLRGGTGDEFPTHLFAAEGIAALCISGTGADPEIYERLADPLALFRAEYENFAKHRRALSSLESVIDVLDRRGLIDPKRVGLTGLSAGVETLQYALIHSHAFAAAATSGGGMEPMSYYGSTKQSREQIFDPIGFGDLAQGKGESWRKFSLSLNVDRINVPLLIQAADREYLHALQTAVTWTVAGKPIEMFVFPDEHHIKWHPAHRFHVYTRNVDWFAFWLKSEEDPDPAKAEQYARWRKLRTQHEAAQRERATRQ